MQGGVGRRDTHRPSVSARPLIPYLCVRSAFFAVSVPFELHICHTLSMVLGLVQNTALHSQQNGGAAETPRHSVAACCVETMLCARYHGKRESCTPIFSAFVRFLASRLVLGSQRWGPDPAALLSTPGPRLAWVLAARLARFSGGSHSDRPRAAVCSINEYRRCRLSCRAFPGYAFSRCIHFSTE